MATRTITDEGYSLYPIYRDYTLPEMRALESELCDRIAQAEHDGDTERADGFCVALRVAREVGNKKLAAITNAAAIAHKEGNDHGDR